MKYARQGLRTVCWNSSKDSSWPSEQQRGRRLNMCGEMLVGGSVCGGMEKEALEFRGME